MPPRTRHSNPGWLAGLLTRYKAAAGKEIAVGYPRGECQAYPDGTSVAQVAYDNCEGTYAPKRDFMTYAEPDIKKRAAPLIKAAVQQMNKGKTQAVIDALLEGAGQEGVGAVKDAILTGNWTPNAPITIIRKGSSQPLIDTSHMINSTTYKIRKKTK